MLLLPGRGAALDKCKALADRLGVRERVRFPGFVSNIEDYYRASDVCVSSSRSEGLPFNVMEAMACGLPAVLTNVKGHEDLVRPGENGELYPYDDRQAFAARFGSPSEPAGTPHDERKSGKKRAEIRSGYRFSRADHIIL